MAREIEIPIAGVSLAGNLEIPDGAAGIVVFAHGSGSSRHSPRNRSVAEDLNARGFATLLFDLLTADEEREDMVTRELRFDIDLLAERLAGVGRWVRSEHDLTVGYFGASTGAAAALVAAALEPEGIDAVVSRGGRPDLAGGHLPEVEAPTLLIVGGNDPQVLQMNRDAMERMRTTVELEVVPGATHLFEEPGALERVSELAGDWFSRYLKA